MRTCATRSNTPSTARRSSNASLAASARPGNDNVVAPSVKFAINPEPIHRYDPEKAKALLKKAGVSNLKIDLSAADVAFTGAVDAATIFRESAAKAGIDLTVVREPNDGYWDNVWQKKAFCASEWLGRPTADGVDDFRVRG